MAHILVVSTDVVGSVMAGPGIRAVAFARSLATRHTVTLAVPAASDRVFDAITLVVYTPSTPGALAPHLARADVVIVQGFATEWQPDILASSVPIVIDLYDPLIIESLDLYATHDIITATAHHTRYQHLTDAQLQRGDFFVCATERQRDYWLGALTACGRITPELVRTTDRDLVSLLAVVPSGIDATPPTTSDAPVLRGVHPAIHPDDVLLVWAGGLWDWFNPAIVLHAMHVIQAELPHLKCCFFAGGRPTSDGTPYVAHTAKMARILADDLGILNRSVVFLDEWVPFAHRGHYLREANAGISAHRPGIETRLAFRTRLLDYVWARLPVICSAGDSLGETIASRGGGMLVEPDTVDGWVAALRRVGNDATWRASCVTALEQIAHTYTWQHMTAPLHVFCENPRRTSPALSTPSYDVVAQLQHRIAELTNANVACRAYARHVEQHYRGAVAQLTALQRPWRARLVAALAQRFIGLLRQSKRP
jgi:hypothetical protein